LDQALKILVVDDDPLQLKLSRKLLEDRGHSVQCFHSGREALHLAKNETPDCIILDLMMPDMDGQELCKHIRDDEALNETRVIVVSAKSYPYDRKRVMDLGADGFIVKPLNAKKFCTEVERIVEDKINLAYWGVRGTLPVPGEKTLRYGGNTCCVSLEFPNDVLFVCDAGTGIKSLSDHLLSLSKSRMKIKLFVSHPHWDHINALPFFVPLYMQGNEIEIIGASHGDVSMEDLIVGSMSGVYFPINVDEFSARVSFRDIHEESFESAGVKINTMLLIHPGNCLGYRFEYKGRSVCYASDNEIYPEASPHYNQRYRNQFINFIKGADILIADATYSDEEYRNKVGWGHSSISEITLAAHDAGVKDLHLFHHDPSQTDVDVERKLDKAHELLKSVGSKTKCTAPSEETRIKL